MNGILFLNSFLSYLVLMLVIVVVAACGFLVGRTLRKRKDAKTPQSEGSLQTSQSENR